jgi:hypothetical protein
MRQDVLIDFADYRGIELLGIVAGTVVAFVDNCF